MIETDAQRVVRLEAEVEFLKDRVERLERELAPPIPVPPQLGATRTERRLLAMLLSRREVRIGAMAALLGNRGGGDVHEVTVRRHISALRRKLPSGAEIRPIFGVGYWMDEASKAAVRAMEEQP